MTAQDVIRALDLRPHPKEGGFFRETYRCDEAVTTGLPLRYRQEPRALATAIYYLLTPETFSCMHRLRSDEIFHFYMGDPVQMLWLWEDGRSETVILGKDILKGQSPQVVVPKGVWQGARLADGGAFALLGTTVSPGFDYTDYEEGSRDHLVHRYPDRKGLIVHLTK